MASQKSSVLEIEGPTVMESKPMFVESSDVRTTATTIKREYIPETEDVTSNAGKRGNFSIITGLTECPSRGNESIPEVGDEAYSSGGKKNFSSNTECSSSENGVTLEVELGANDAGENSNFPNITECLFRKIKAEDVDVGHVDDLSASKCVTHNGIITNLAEDDVMFIKEEEIEDNINENTEASRKEVAQVSRSYNITAANHGNALKGGDAETQKKGEIEGNIRVVIEGAQEKVVKTSFNDCMSIRNHEVSLVENGVKLHKEEDIEDHVEEEITEADILAGVEEIHEKVAQTSVNNYSTIGDHKNSSMESGIKSYEEKDPENYVEEGIEKAKETEARTSISNHASNQQDSSIENDVKQRHYEVDIEDYIKEGSEKSIEETKETVAQTLVDIRGKMGNHEDSSVKCDVKLHEGKNIIDLVNGGTEKNIEGDKNGVVQTSGGSRAMTGNHEDSLVEGEVKLHKEEVIEDYVEEDIGENIEERAQKPVITDATNGNQVDPQCNKASMQSAPMTEQTIVNHENDFDSRGGVLSANFIRIKEENDSVSFDVGESQQSRVYYDSSRIKIVDVSVIVEDLFLEIWRHDPQKPVQKHINSKHCKCIFCTRKFKSPNKNFSGARNISPKPSHSIEGNLKELGSKNWRFCTLCPARFRFTFHLRRHSAMNHGVFVCSECSSNFQLESDLRDHLKTHLVNESYPCAFCSFKGRVEAELEIHARIHSVEKFFSCAQCLIEFTESYSLLDHIQKHSSVEPTVKYKNKTILKDYSAVCLNKPNLNDSFLKLKQTSPFSAYSNDQTPSYTSNPTKFNQTLLQQPNSTTNTNTQSFLCKSTVEFTTRFPVEHHSSTQISENPPPNVQNAPKHNYSKSCSCRCCIRKFETSDLPKVSNKNMAEYGHIARENSGDAIHKKWNSCNICPARFRFMFNLTKHCAVTHHVYLCSACAAQFQRESDLQTHLKMHAAYEMYFCPFCSFRGRVEAELEIHARTHTTENLFSCAYCLLEFEKSYSLLDHMQVHLSAERAAKVQSGIDLSECLMLHSSKEPVSNEDVDFRPKDCVGEDVPHFTSVKCPVQSDAMLNPENYKAEEKKVKYFDSSCKFANVSVVLEDLFQKIPSDNSQKPLQRHINSGLCSCVFCTGKFKLQNEIITSMETEVNTTKSSLFAKECAAKPVNKKWNSCKLCPARFRFPQDLKIHSATSHSLHICLECPRKFYLKSSLKTHVKKHPVEMLYSCAFCSLECDGRVELKKHVKSHCISKLYSCGHCLVEFDSSQSLTDHVQSHACTAAGVKFKKKTDRRIRKQLLLLPNKDSCPNDSVSKTKLESPVAPRANKQPSSHTSFLTKLSQIPHPKSNLKTNTPSSMCNFSSTEQTINSPVEHHPPTECQPSDLQNFGTRYLANAPHLKSDSAAIPSSQSFARNNSSAESANIPAQRHSQIDVIEHLSSDVQNFDMFERDQISYAKSELTAKACTQASTCNYPTESTTVAYLKGLSTTPVNESLASEGRNVGTFELDQIPNLKCSSTAKTSAQSFSQNFSSTESTMGSSECHSLIHVNNCSSSNAGDSKTVKKLSKQRSHLLNKRRAPPANVIATERDKSHFAGHLNEKRFSCAICAVAFKFKGNLKQHILRIHSDERLFSCPECTVTFKSKSEARAHSAVHSNERPFGCSLCASKFKHKVHLQRHLAVHSTERPFLCETCRAAFKTNCDLARHLMTHSTEKPFACGDCTATFKLKSQLRMHSEVHSTVKPFSCENCGATFTSKLKLRKHCVAHLLERQFSCLHCSATFKRRSALKRHAEVHVAEKLFSCAICAAAFKTKRAVATHLTVHATDKPHSCQGCTASFKTKNMLRLHSAVHSNDRQFSCAICATKFKSKKEVKNHLLVHSNEKPFSCHLCHSAFKKRVFLRRHLATIHSNERPFQCPICTATFKRKSDVPRHLVVHTTDRLFRCSYCAASFKTKTHLKQHLPIHLKVKPVSCTICGAAFKTERALKSHSSVHSIEKRLPCLHCDATFKSAQTLKHHLHVHSNDRPFGCPHCVATFKTKQILNQHLAIHSSERKFSCGYCNLAFKCKRALKSHLICHSKEKPFSCSICATRFKTRVELKSHSSVHSNNRPFQCTQCDATFKTRLGLHYHQRTHLSEKQYTCAHCDATFKTKDGIRSHLIVHASAKPFSCKECSATFKTKLGFKLHSVVHSDERPYVCQKCRAGFKTQTSLREHLTCHTEHGPYSCAQCFAKFKSKCGIMLHSAVHSNT